MLLGQANEDSSLLIEAHNLDVCVGAFVGSLSARCSIQVKLASFSVIRSHSKVAVGRIVDQLQHVPLSVVAGLPPSASNVLHALLQNTLLLEGPDADDSGEARIARAEEARMRNGDCLPSWTKVWNKLWKRACQRFWHHTSLHSTKALFLG